MDQSVEPAVSAAEPAPPRRRSRSVWLLLGLLFAALAVLGFDRLARSGRENAFEALVKVLPRNLEQLEQVRGTDKAITPTKVRELVGRAPDGAAKQEFVDLVERYSWRGIQQYTLRVIYVSGEQPCLRAVEKL
jgi:hypothetical protein